MDGRGDQVQVGRVVEEGKTKWAGVGKLWNECTRREDGRLELSQPARMMVAMLDSNNTEWHAAGQGQPTCGVERVVVERIITRICIDIEAADDKQGLSYASGLSSSIPAI